MSFDDDDDLAEIREGDLNRRRILLGGGVLVVAAAGAASLWGLQRTKAGGGARDELVVAYDGTSSSRFGLDPHNSGFAPLNRVMRSIYDNLTVLLPDQSVGPWLAESWEVSPDRTRYDFKLRHGVKFHDGTVFDAAALKANFDRLVGPNTVLYSRRSLGPYLSSEVIAADRLRVTLKRPFTPFLRNLSMTKLSIVSPTAVKKGGKLYAQKPVGTGPFRFIGVTPGAEIRLERNPDYRWAPSTAAHAGPAKLQKLTFKNVPEESTRVAVLRSGQAHVADLIPPQDLLGLKKDPAIRVLEKELLNTNYSLALNATRAPWNDPDIRLAVKLSLDINTIVRVVYLGTLPRAWSALSPSMFGSAEKILTDSWTYDLARAKEILTQKGWVPGPDGIRIKDGKRLTIDFLDAQGNREKRLDVVQFARRQLAASGIDLTVDSVSTGIWMNRIRSGDYDMTGGASFDSDPDILRSFYSPAARSAFASMRVVDPQLIAWLDAAAEEGDEAKRAEFYHQVQRRIDQQVYAIPIYVLIYNLATASQVKGVTLDAHGFPEFHGAWLEAA